MHLPESVIIETLAVSLQSWLFERRVGAVAQGMVRNLHMDLTNAKT